MALTIRREKPNRVAIQLPIDAFHLGVVPDVGAPIALHAGPGRMEFWRREQWRDDMAGTATLISAHIARTVPGDD